MKKILQGDIYWVNLNPTKGMEQQGIRPCVVVSGNSMNMHSGLSLVCPLSSSLKQYFCDVVLSPDLSNGLKNESEVLVSQVRVIDQSRFENKLGRISETELKQLLKGIFMILTH